MYRNILWTLFGPVFYMCGRQSERHSSPSMNTNQQHIDFWGPCLTFSIYSAILWLAQAKDVSWLYVSEKNSLMHMYSSHAYVPKNETVFVTYSSSHYGFLSDNRSYGAWRRRSTTWYVASGTKDRN